MNTGRAQKTEKTNKALFYLSILGGGKQFKEETKSVAVFGFAVSSNIDFV